MKIPAIKDVMREQAAFVKYEDGKLWYQIIYSDDAHTPRIFDFPVPINDVGGGSFGSHEKSLTLMRWVRKHIEYLNGAVEEFHDPSGKH